MKEKKNLGPRRKPRGRRWGAAGTTAIIILVATQLAWAQGKLPQCPGHFAANKWTNCWGKHMTETANTYAGEWVNNQFNGHGTYTYRDGRKYVGQFRNNRRNGEGTFTWKDGASYVGGYKEDMRSGKGTFTYPNGTKFVGEFQNDRRNGLGTEYRADGTVLQSGTWKDDVLVKRQ